MALPTQIHLRVPTGSRQHRSRRAEPTDTGHAASDGDATISLEDSRRLVYRKVTGPKAGGAPPRTTGWKRFQKFQLLHHLPPLSRGDDPVDVGEQLLWFATYLYEHTCLRGNTITGYVSTAKLHADLITGSSAQLPGPTTAFFRRIRAEDGTPNARAACTPPLARESANVAGDSDVALEASILLLWYGTRRVSFASHHSATKPSDWELTWSCVRFAVDDETHREIAFVHYKHSKAQLYNQGGVQSFFAIPGSRYCPVAALKRLHSQCHALGCAGPSDPVFRRRSGRLVTARSIGATIKIAAKNLGLNPDRYGSHSFRIGSANTAFDRGISMEELKVHGLWASDAFLDYVRTSPKRARVMSDALCLDRADDLDAELRHLWEEFIRSHHRPVRRP